MYTYRDYLLKSLHLSIFFYLRKKIIYQEVAVVSNISVYSHIYGFNNTILITCDNNVSHMFISRKFARLK